jgi:hypothetical protein
MCLDFVKFGCFASVINLPVQSFCEARFPIRTSIFIGQVSDNKFGRPKFDPHAIVNQTLSYPSFFRGQNTTQG